MNKTLHKFDILSFQTKLISWYEENKRELPWRETIDPYKIWVSEIMLQQTKVDTVIPYYEKFMEHYPTIFDLALTDEQDVLKDWEGLGYYSRARNLLEATREVVETYNGVVPDNPKELGELKGVGPYTKGAILSIAFNKPEPAVDGNVMRVLSRVLLIKDNISEQKVRKKFEEIVREVISKKDPSSFNQGLMELGALICTPRSPSCLLCPVQQECRAFEEGIQEKLPVKMKKKKQRVVSYHVLLLTDDQNRVAIEQRPSEGLLANMWQFPMIPTDGNDIEMVVKQKYGLKIKVAHELGTVKHVFSHKIWNLTIYQANYLENLSIKVEQGSSLQFVSEKELETFPFPVSHLKVREIWKDTIST
ncbi:A/G-specific adenine glycosylase [Pseudogracilibacillus sp. SE30717A]|uniref:A/G-specific adenine glycosylase n=1 Tax=Pseudogracilibacillus sp. SE30717A TaxID=3098293 RepID=UPI00300DFC01